MAMRIFIAVDLPDQVRERIAEIAANFDRSGVKLVKPELVHVTMKFLGEVEERVVKEICTALSGVASQPFKAQIGGVGAFPKPSYIRVIWLGASGSFDLLHSEVDRILGSFGFAPDDDFVAHATIARVKRVSRETRIELGVEVSKLAETMLGEFTVDSLSVKSSTLTPEGPIYKTVCEIPLKGTERYDR